MKTSDLPSSTYLPYGFIRDRLSGELCEQFINALAIKGSKPRNRRKNKQSPISTTTQRQAIYRMVFLLQHLAISTSPDLRLDKLDANHVAIMVQACVNRAGSIGSLDNWISTLNRLLAITGQRGATHVVSAAQIRKMLLLGHRPRACSVNKGPADPALVNEAIAAVSAVDERAGAVLRLLALHPIRLAEAVSLNLSQAYEQALLNKSFEVKAGAKNGLTRSSPVWTQNQLDVLRSLIPMGNKQHGSLIPEDQTRLEFLSKLYKVFRQCGVTKGGRFGFTAHSLRHMGLQSYFEHKTGEPPPIVQASGRHSRDAVLVEGYRKVSLAAGHFDTTKSSAYLGSIRLARVGLSR